MDWQTLKKNPQNWSIFKKRARYLDKIRQFFKTNHFLEVTTPLLSPALLPESYLDIFRTELQSPSEESRPGFLTPSPEIWHKKLLAAGSGNIFEITKSFRNGDFGSPRHNAEFTMLEWYHVNAGYRQTMVDCEQLLRALLPPSQKIHYQGQTLDLTAPFERISVPKAFAKYAACEKSILCSSAKLVNFAKAKGYPAEDYETAFSLIYVADIEPHLGTKTPTIIYDYPANFAPLAKTKADDPQLKERFELYLFGIELADAYSELTDPVEQAAQFAKEQCLRRSSHKVSHPTDLDFLNALASGLPKVSGVALGLDRLFMILQNKTSVDEVMLFSDKEIFAF